MDYTALVSKRQQYKYSVNICFDLKNEDRLADYVPNRSTTEILREFLGGMIHSNSHEHSRILYGSYGTGKSHLLTVLGTILEHRHVEGDAFQSFLEMLDSYDPELTEDIRCFVSQEKPYLVVPVFAEYPDFSQCVSFSLKKALDQNGIKVAFKGFFEDAYQLVNLWNEGEESSTRLDKACSKQSISVDSLLNGLFTYDTNYEKIFHRIYSQMTYGATFHSTSGGLVDNLNLANAAIQDQYRGIVILFDEFGRYVEDYGNQIKVKSVQDLAEYCDHSDFDDYLFLVSHKQLSLYTREMQKNIADEWKKIEGRFKATSINARHDQSLSLIGHVLPKTQHWSIFKVVNQKSLNRIYEQAWKFKGFLLSPEDQDRNVFEDVFPLHPITLFALDRLSKKIAQNERSFFTYLAGDDEFSLFDKLRSLDVNDFCFVGLDDIFDYFEPNIRAYKTSESYESYKKLQVALNKLAMDMDSYEVRILKALTVIRIVSDTDILMADYDTLLNVINGNQAKLEKALKNLESIKIIRFMRQYGFYDYFDSSIYDIEKMIDESILGITDTMVVSTLNEKFGEFALFPYAYNEKYYINRVFIPIFATADTVLKDKTYAVLPKYYDGVAVFVLDNGENKDLYCDTEKLPKRSVLLINSSSTELVNEIKRYIAIRYLSSKSEEISKQDPTVENELSMYLDEQQIIVEKSILDWRTLKNPNICVISDGMVQNVSSEQELSTLLSNVMETSFCRTIMINNALLNKNTVTAAIRIARRKAIASIIEHDNIYEDCAFLSPEYNIIRSSLSKNGLVPNDSVDEKQMIEDSSLNRFDDNQISGIPVFDVIRDILTEAQKGSFPLKELYHTLKSEPFGLRDGCIPVLIAYALREYQNVSLYFHGSERSYTAEELITAIEDSDNYSLFISNWTEEQTKYVETMEQIFHAYLPHDASSNRLEKLYKSLNTHFASISKSARTTAVYVSDITKQYREILSLTYKDYNKFFFEILSK